MGIHNYGEKLKRYIRIVKEDDGVSETDKETILDFKDQLFVEDLSKARIAKYLRHLRKISKWMDSDLKDAEKEDIVQVMRKVREEDYSDWTKKDYKVVLKRFYRWLNNGEYPDKVNWLKTTIKKNHRKLPEELLSKDDVKELINAAQNLRDKAFVAALYESGCRIGEFGTLQLKHIKFDEYGAKLIVNGKSGARRVRLISSVPYLKEWLENYPKEKEPEHHLWINIGTRRQYEKMRYGAMRSLLKRLAERAGIEKPVNPHNFRHSRATHLANHLTEAQMCEYFGWVQGSDQPATYVHLSGRDLDNKLLQLYGKKKKDDNGEEDMKPIKCPRCGHKNGSTNKFCSRCGMPLDPKVAQEVEDKKENMDNLMKKLLKDPEVKELILEKISKGLKMKLLERLFGKKKKVSVRTYFLKTVVATHFPFVFSVISFLKHGGNENVLILFGVSCFLIWLIPRTFRER